MELPEDDELVPFDKFIDCFIFTVKIQKEVDFDKIIKQVVLHHGDIAGIIDEANVENFEQGPNDIRAFWLAYMIIIFNKFKQNDTHCKLNIQKKFCICKHNTQIVLIKKYFQIISKRQVRVGM
eukprot:TRINITY_DN25555_c0_g1_i1.p3 TRINITY_DN25555_c0_g1~~TRINITY_DN25555_c0_g1_i1.p3  ORF type:complete len:123 (+),score=7.25 TRINITY_DN25555_c0_g1_i1:271-639(+)